MNITAATFGYKSVDKMEEEALYLINSTLRRIQDLRLRKEVKAIFDEDTDKVNVFNTLVRLTRARYLFEKVRSGHYQYLLYLAIDTKNLAIAIQKSTNDDERQDLIKSYLETQDNYNTLEISTYQGSYLYKYLHFRLQ